MQKTSDKRWLSKNYKELLKLNKKVKKPNLTTPVFLLGEFHGQRSVAGYSPWGHTESDTTKQLSLSLSKTLIDTSPKKDDCLVTKSCLTLL